MLHIAKGNGQYAELDHQQFLRIAQASAVKAAVYVDLGVEEGLWAHTEAAVGKEHLRQVNDLLASF